MDGINGRDLDRWITGNWGEDSVNEPNEGCIECQAKNLEDDQEWACPYDGDVESCEREREADAKNDARRDEQ